MWHTRSFHGTVLSASSGDSLADFIGLSPSAMRTAAPRSSGGAPREGSAARWGARLKAEAADARESKPEYILEVLLWSWYHFSL